MDAYQSKLADPVNILVLLKRGGPELTWTFRVRLYATDDSVVFATDIN